ncbi:MAG: HAD-IIA family hydrolase [Paludisphaera borealis]|uniref:HAD-IIA family hydrolase n=1 Tax=Paludisphaera borealis TaxID=1387353 RepID=UPI00283B9473|nr:HAD-IIA family hydrolase [Paludisphaera borealis]MDR3621834.1 HAD-IIA family hydrolase [Paludisphaera borealis]
MTLREVRGFAFDLDGTIWAGPHLLPGAAELVEALRRAGYPLVFASNSSRYGSEALARELTRLGIPAARHDVIAAFDLVADEIHDRLGPVDLLAIGTSELASALEEAGHRPLPMDRWREAKAVVVGNDPLFDFGRLRAASRAVAAGAVFFAVNMDERFPVADGQFDPGCGALAEAVATAARVRPIVVGKPHPRLFEAAIARLGCSARQAAMVGDNQASDIVGGRSVGMFTIWLEPQPACEPTTQPDLAVASLTDLHRLWLDGRAGPGETR